MNEIQNTLNDLERELLQAWAEDRLEDAGAELSGRYPEHTTDIIRITLALVREEIFLDMAAEEATQ